MAAYNVFVLCRDEESDRDGINHFPELRVVNKNKCDGTVVRVTPHAPWHLTKEEKGRIQAELKTLKLAHPHGQTIKDPIKYPGFLKSYDW
jgi:hypothetical protein